MRSIIGKICNSISHPRVGEIWCLHRVVPSRSSFKSNRDLEITPDFLEYLIKEKAKQGFHFVNMDSFVNAASIRPWKRKLIHITFDDGFADVFLHAYPILKKYSIPFTLYVSTDMPDGNADLWWLQLEQLSHGNAKWFEQTMKHIYSNGGGISDSMHALTDSERDPSICRRLSISWEQLRIMVSEGLCTIGSHGVSHSSMSRLPEESVIRELLDSRARLKEMLGVDANHFSYPHSMFTEITNQLVWQSGYHTAVLGFGGQTRFQKGNRLFYREFIVQP